ncbi:DUF4450 domain-containing protein [Bacteroides sp. 214]|uniref:DUF4450 domain-containing protein n=1 Tax=Bacteroides sp. 214 TaxID=2302935 RepID=UPI0013CF6C1E|nr:DUF4450 domain-containing protein [Bacteroides sp. 214]NDW11456.1 DUF4450 domain-containing protein [Bacteroides sp. 214]
MRKEFQVKRMFRKGTLTALLGAVSVFGIAQPASSIASLNEAKHLSPRVLRYSPVGEDFVIVNGDKRYNRALYGGHTAYRLETSDRPIFAAYQKNGSQNISFRLTIPGHGMVLLEEVLFCESRYTAGKRSYKLTDPLWGKGEIEITALALYEEEGAIWKIEARNMPKGAELIASQAKIKAPRLNRNGDMGVDPEDSFDKPDEHSYIRSRGWTIDGEYFVDYLMLRGVDLEYPMYGINYEKELFEKTEATRAALAGRIKFSTPDPYINPIGGALAVAADGIWDGEVWLHGAVGWRMPLSGWRAAYTGNFLGWHDRAKKHFDAYAASQVTEVPNTIPHPAQDPDMNLARSIKEWGTPQYSNGYICRNPNRNDQMHHYDMNLCYIDELLWHFNWTGDVEYMRQMWPTLTRHLAWEKRNYDPNDDGLYDAYACIWASDALYYNSGAVTHSSAYNYRANKLAAQIAQKIGEDPTPYQKEAEKILAALNQHLWMPERGHWAEFQDFMGHKRLHPNAAVWSIYHAIDSDVADPFQAYQATRYVDTEIPHFEVKADGLLYEGYKTIATTNWLPYSWSINNVAFAEVMHTALAYFQAGRNEEGFLLLKSSALDGMYLGGSPGNFGQVSFYDAARGECYRDFGDPVGVASRLYIQGLFGINPDALNGRLVVRPGFPAAWEHAALQTPDITLNYKQEGNTDIYRVEQRLPQALELSLQVHARMSKIAHVTVNGEAADWKLIEKSIGCPSLEILTQATEADIRIEWGGTPIVQKTVSAVKEYGNNDPVRVPLNGSFRTVYDPQRILKGVSINTDQTALFLKVEGEAGHRTLFVQVQQDDMTWWQPVDVEVKKEENPQTPAFVNVVTKKCAQVNMDNLFNSSVTDIFRNEYLTPRSPYTTLQLPIQGIGEWCHPKMTAEIDDSGLRASLKKGLFDTRLGVAFRSPASGNNIAYTSLWDNYPDKLQVPLKGKATRAYLMMAGSTNHMQCHMVNATVTVYYKDGSSGLLELTPPDNWCPIEQDFFVDNISFRLNAPRPYRVHLKSGLVSNDLEKDLGIKGVYGRAIDGGAGVLLDMKLNPDKELDYLELETIANDVVVGLMGVTLQR